MPNRMSRRHLLLSGAASALAVAGVSGCDRFDGAPSGDDAYEPWRSLNARPTGPRDLIHAAILAANAHNTQPWMFSPSEHGIAICADETRNLGAMDPFRREMHISIGCALQNLMLAAQAHGQEPTITPNGGTLDEPKPDGRPRPVASIALTAGPTTASPLFAAIAKRHTNRAAYDPERAIGDAHVADLAALQDQRSGAGLVLLTDAKARADFVAATLDATAFIIGDATMIADSDAWFRATSAEIAAHRDGPTIDAAGLSRLMTVLAKILPAPSPERAHKYWLDQTRDVQLASAPLFGLITVKDLYDREQAVQAGMLWQRVHLQATLLGLAAQPLNQLPERVDRERQLGLPPQTAKSLAALTGGPDRQATFAFRIGWPGRPVGPSPRRKLDAVIQETAC